MNTDRLHISWNKQQNAQEIERIANALEAHFPEHRFCIRMVLSQPQPGRSQADIDFYTEGTEEDCKICTIRHILSSYLSIPNVIAAVRTALHKPDTPSL